MNFSALGLWFSYFLRCKGPNRIHSPFIYDLYFHHILERRPYYAFVGLRKLRAQLLADERVLEGNDWGAGEFRTRKVSHIAARALQPEREAELLFRLVLFFRPKTIIELGSSLGLTTLYLHNARPSATLHTFEGHSGTAQFARRLFEQNGAAEIMLHEGPFAETLPELLFGGLKPDWVLLDGDHRYGPLLQYMNMLKPHLTENSVVVVDDIRWSSGMWKAWKQLCDDPFWELKLDIGKMGILIRRKAQTPQHFILRYPN
jgi:predicted O-methyltransferase YrrM